MENILITIGDRFVKEGKQILSQLGEARYITCNRKELLASAKNVTVLVVGLEHMIDQEVIDACAHLKIIATATTGTDHIDLEYAEAKGIEILSLKDETDFLQSITPTAELALGLVIALVRRICPAFDDVKNGKWNREEFESQSLSGKTLGIIGLGRLGSMMAQYGRALGMRVIYFDPNVDSKEFEHKSFNDLLKESDVLSIHVHLSEQTQNMFNAGAFALVKPGIFIVNTARGKIVDEESLIAALESRTVAGYATDVLTNELTFTEQASSPLIEYSKTHSNVIITPHIGGMTTEARGATDVFIAKKVRDTLQGA